MSLGLRRLPVLVVCLALSAACGDRSMHASIEKMNEGVELFNAGQFQQAEKKLEEATALVPDNYQAWYNLGMVRTELKKWERAADAFGNAVKNQPKNAMYHYRLGHAYTQGENPNWDLAQQHLEEAVGINDRLFKAHYYLGRVYARKGMTKQAAEEWTTSASISPSNFGLAFNALGKLYIRWDMPELAVKVLDTGIAKITVPQEAAELYYHLGLAYQKQNKLQEAVDAYTNALERRKANMDAVRQRGFAYADLGEKEKAKADLDAFVKSKGSDNPIEVQTANQRLMRLQAE